MTEPSARIEKWDDLSAVLVVRELEETWFKWDVVEITATMIDGDPNRYGFELRDSKNCDVTENIEDAERLIHGVIKWDGCSHFDFGPDTGGYIHLCGANEALKLTKIIKRLFDFAAANMKSFDRKLAKYPEQPQPTPSSFHH